MIPLVGGFKGMVDGQGRVSYPSQFREALKQEEHPTLIAMKGPERTIKLFPLSSWKRVKPRVSHEEFQTLRLARNYTRAAYQGMELVVPDGAGRIQLSAELREHAAIGREYVLFKGLNDFVEVWSEKRHRAYMDALAVTAGSIDEMAAELAQLRERKRRQKAETVEE